MHYGALNSAKTPCGEDLLAPDLLTVNTMVTLDRGRVTCAACADALARNALRIRLGIEHRRLSAAYTDADCRRVLARHAAESGRAITWTHQPH